MLQATRRKRRKRRNKPDARRTTKSQMSEETSEKPATQGQTGQSRPSRAFSRNSESPRNRRFRRGNEKKPRRLTFQQRFSGATENLKGNIFDIAYNQTELYNATIKAIAEHVGITYKNGADVRSSVKQLSTLSIIIDDEPQNATALQSRVWSREVDNAVRRIDILSQNLKTLYSLVWGQCSPPMRAKIESLEGFDEIKRQANGIALLIGVKNICFGAVEADKYRPQTMHENIRRFYQFKQDKFMTESEYLEKFKTLVEVCDSVGCQLGEFKENADKIIKDT